MTPSGVLQTIASSNESTMAASRGAMASSGNVSVVCRVPGRIPAEKLEAERGHTRGAGSFQRPARCDAMIWVGMLVLIVPAAVGVAGCASYAQRYAAYGTIAFRWRRGDAVSVQLRISQRDDPGRRIAGLLQPVGDTAPAHGRALFDMRVPDNGPSYRVRTQRRWKPGALMPAMRPTGFARRRTSPATSEDEDRQHERPSAAVTPSLAPLPVT